ncbi:NAD(P)H-dependent oxidoreductase [Oerskovia sp. Sa1BUA8]|uniref:NAD(P)H-dependent oxidoreductase n=1 Tax=Oerskovia douganii TaxID=2762210 RepID=A0A9D5Z0H1_9CELL|nr:NAD(P)H-dependent oxidoreductase [Oerskovia douganii]MBE7701169.1 NAD(P)H-dependent oxidoreductase [Oerskovia douganii]
MTQHTAPPPVGAADSPAPGPARPAVVTLVGNPRPASRTLTAAQAVAARVADDLGLAPRATIDLADLAAELLAPAHPRADTARTVAASASVLVVATPVYKGSYTGLLKAFLDLYGPDGLAGVVAVPVVVSGNPAHALAGEVHLRPLLVELGATVPARTLTLVDSRLGEPDLTDALDTWLGHAGGLLRRAVGGTVFQDATAPRLAGASR